MIPHPIKYTMPRYSDDWVISKSLFEYTTGGSCQCCAFPAIFDPNGLKGLISSVSDLETDAANEEFNAAQQSPWPPEMRDSVWADRVRVRHKLKKEMKDYKEFMDEVGEERLREFLEKDLGAVGVKKILQMPRSEVTNILSNRYNSCAAFGTIMCAVVEQVANFKLTKYETDARGAHEIEFEKALRYDRFGGFTMDVVQECDNGETQMNQETLSILLTTIQNLGGEKLLHRGPSSQLQGDDNEENGGADDAVKEKVHATQSFRSDRRIARLIIARFWADQIMAKLKKTRTQEDIQEAS